MPGYDDRSNQRQRVDEAQNAGDDSRAILRAGSCQIRQSDVKQQVAASDDASASAEWAMKTSFKRRPRIVGEKDEDRFRRRRLAQPTGSAR